MTNPMVDIVMTTHNASQFLEQQLDSIVAQSYSHWRLFISDDGSSDATPTVLQRYHDGQRIIDVTPNQPFHNVSQNVEYVLAHTHAEYVMFSDHDDVWMPDKLSRSMTVIQELGHDSNTPLLVYTDLEVVDAQLHQLDVSLWHYSHLKPTTHLPQLLFQNVVTGCTMTVNRALIDKATPFPEDVFMYDWWIALVAAAFGTLIPIATPTVRYRQHRFNLVGASALNRHTIGCRPWLWPKTIANLKDIFVRRLDRTTQQTQAFLDRYGVDLDDATRHTLNVYTTLRHQAFLQRRYLGWKSGCFGNSLYTAVGMWLFL